MGKILLQEKVKLICGLLWNAHVRPEDVYPYLENAWGRIEDRSEVFDFSFTDYYLDESGPELKKQYLSFETPIAIETIPSIKIAANTLEDTRFAPQGKRNANIDPGYIADAKLVMATTKNLPHRIFIGQNIYTDLQLIFKKPSFFPVSWTFADVKQPAIIAFFNRVRERYMEQLRVLRSGTE